MKHWLFSFGVAVMLALSWTVAFTHGAAAAPNDFDHAATGFLLEDGHAGVSCESCHVNGVFEGTPRRCAACHECGGLINATPKPIDHINT